MSELNLPVEEATPAHTNTAYIEPAIERKEPPVLLSVSKAIIVETIKDFFVSIFGFFYRYVKHFVRCLVYFINPSLQKKPFDRLDFKENSKHAFEFVIIVLAILIFMIKLSWIPASSKNLVELYNNDLSQKFMEVFLFAAFAVSYIVIAGIAILFGRLLRRLFRIPLHLHEADILYVYMNNAFFSFAAVITLVLRSMASWEVNDNDSLTAVLFTIVIPSVVLPLAVWGVRFPVLHKMGWGKGIGFFLLSIILFSAFYGVALAFLCAFAMGV